MWIKILTSGWTYAAFMAALFGWQLLKNAQLEATQAQAQRDAAIALSDAVNAARKEEQEKTQRYIAAVDQLTKDNETTRNEKDRIIADLRTDNRRLRGRFTCQAPSLPGESNSPGVGDAAAQGGLLREDAEFLVRFAAEADERVNELTACQAVLKDVK